MQPVRNRSRPLAENMNLSAFVTPKGTVPRERLPVADKKGRRDLYEKPGKEPDGTVDWQAAAEYSGVSFRQTCMSLSEACGIVGRGRRTLWRRADGYHEERRSSCPAKRAWAAI